MQTNELNLVTHIDGSCSVYLGYKFLDVFEEETPEASERRAQSWAAAYAEHRLGFTLDVSDLRIDRPV
jgi:hypothetical protein